MTARFKILSFFMALAFWAVLVAAAPAAAEKQEAFWYDGTWAHEHNDIPPDEVVTFGRLENGLRYAVIPNKFPAGRVTMMLNVQAGSLMETADELGFAHFVEHMAFNGTANFPPGSLIPFFQKNGMSIGGDTNAHTSLSETVYKLDLATADKQNLSTGLTVLRDFADGQTMLPKEVADEAAVILAEKTARDSEGFQAGRKRREALYHGTKFVNDTIGTEKTIKNAASETLLDFYRKWYRPERMILVVVGEVSPNDVIPMIEEKFGNIAASGQNPVVENWGEPSLGGLKAFFDKRPITSTSVSVMINHPRAHQRDSLARQKEMIVDSLMQFCMQQRLEVRDLKEPELWSSGSFSFNRSTVYLPSAFFYAVATGTGWQKVLTVFNEEMRTAGEYGFSEDELNRAKEQLAQFLESMQADRASMSNKEIAAGFVAVANEDIVYTSPEYDLAYYAEIKDAITIDDVNAALKEALAPDNRIIYISGDADIKSEDEIIKAWQDAEQLAVKPFAQEQVRPFPYLPLPAEPKALPNLEKKVRGGGAPDYYHAVLPNQVEIYLMPMDYEKDQVALSLLFGQGVIGLPDDKAPLVSMASLVINEGGVGALTRIESGLLFSSKGITVSESYGDRAHIISGWANNKDLKMMIEAVWTQYKDPVPLAQHRDKVLQHFEFMRFKRHNTIEGVDSAESGKFFNGNFKRFASLEEEDAVKVSLSDIDKFIKETRQHGPVKILVSGDFNKDEALRLLTKLFGAEEVKPVLKPGPNPVTPVFPVGRDDVIEVPDKVNKAIFYMAFRNDFADVAQQDRLIARQLAASVISDRMRVTLREKLGSTYGSSCFYQFSYDYDGYGMLTFAVPTDVPQLEVAKGGVQEVIREFLQHGVKDEELARIIPPMRTGWTTARKRIALWHSLTQGEILVGLPYITWHNDYLERLEAATPEAVTEAGREMLSAAPKASLTLKQGAEKPYAAKQGVEQTPLDNN